MAILLYSFSFGFCFAVVFWFLMFYLSSVSHAPDSIG